MSWRSLFAFDNPNGEVGRQFTATSNYTIGASLIQNSNNKTILATFATLPIGVYSLTFQTDIDWKQNISISFCEIGLSQTASNPVAIFPSSSLLINLINNAVNNINSPLNANFIFSVTNANPYYIYINTTIGGSVSPQFTSVATCIATKLA
jgi:hypothetical protein